MTHYTEIVIELFKRNQFSILTDHGGKEFKKQKQAFKYLTDQTTTELVFGGGAGGSKSYTGWMWLTLMCLAYDETHYFVARDTLKDLRLYGMQTFTEVKYALNLENEKDYKYNAQDGFIEFTNKSKIYLIECKRKPSDMDFHGLGSSLFTSGFIEEAGEVHFDAYDVLCSRVNRWNNARHSLLGKIFITCNPAKNWLYNEFYKKDQNETLPDNQKFLPALAKDNPYCPSEYIERLSNLRDKNKRARLFLGQWEYDDDPTALISYDDILSIFDNNHIGEGDKYIVADIARYGSDKAIITYWNGLRIEDYHIFEKSSTTEIVNVINAYKSKYYVKTRNVIVDDDGVGGGVVDSLRCIGFVNNSKPNNTIYQNLKTECAYKLSELITHIWFKADIPNSIKETITEELGQLKTYDSDKESKLRIVPKEKIKDNIGRSPDWLDVFIMRMHPYIKVIKSPPVLYR